MVGWRKPIIDITQSTVLKKIVPVGVTINVRCSLSLGVGKVKKVLGMNVVRIHNRPISPMKYFKLRVYCQRNNILRYT